MLFFERPTGGERAVIVHVKFSEDHFHEDLEEFRQLAVSAGVSLIHEVIGSRQAPDPKYFVGSGKLDEILEAITVFSCEIVLFNHALHPSQEKNLERYLKCRVIGRVTLILDIFAQRAQTHEGKLQVELAQLQHLSARLVRGWTHLERQRGGVGLRGGPGETQLESDRRAIRVRIDVIKTRLEKVRSQRAENRKSRQKSNVPVIALVGYTNAGKSTLFNALTGQSAYVADRLFATLDPVLRKIKSAEAGDVIIADTVGFIRHLPHELVQAFRSTLEEVKEAELLLHVIDCHSPLREDNMSQVNDVLQKIEADKVPILEIFNKADLLDIEPRIDYNDEGKPMRVWVSAQKNLGIDLLEKAIGQYLGLSRIIRHLSLNPREGKFRAELYDRQLVKEETCDESGNFLLCIYIDQLELDRLFNQFQINPDCVR